MITRVLGKTGLEICPVGFGAWAIGGSWGPQNDDESLAALRRFDELGGNFIDTALAYGNGHSERLIGRFLRENSGRDRFILASKIPPCRAYEGPATRMEECFPLPYIRECVDTTLANLGVEQLDIIQLHSWAESWNNETAWLGVMEDLKRQGKIRFFGVSVMSYREQEFVEMTRRGLVDTIQVRFNLLDQGPLAELLPAAEQSNTGVIVRTPLGSGMLTGKMTRETTFQEGDWRRGWLNGEKLRDLDDHMAQLSYLLEGRTWPEAAIQFVLGHPQVSAAIPGIRSVRQAEQNFAALGALPLTSEELDRAHALYRAGFGREEPVLWR